MLEDFNVNRAEIGMLVGDRELSRRLAHELQLPQHYGVRLLKAYRRILHDALESGEGFNLGVGIVRMTQFDTREYNKGFQIGQKRTKMYKYTWTTTEHGNETLENLTKENYGV